MNYPELKEKVFKLDRTDQLLLLYKLLGWFEVAKDNAEFVRATETCIKEFEAKVKA